MSVYFTVQKHQFQSTWAEQWCCAQEQSKLNQKTVATIACGLARAARKATASGAASAQNSLASTPRKQSITLT
jgi:hypothetical protein